MIRTIQDPVIFNGADINAIDGVQVTAINPFRFQNRTVTNNDLAFADGSSTSSAFYGKRVINITAIIAQSTRNLMETSLAEIRRVLNPVNKTMSLPFENQYRYVYECTLSNLTISDVAGGYCKVELEITAADPFSYDKITTELLNVVNLTSGDKTYPVTVEGTADQPPIVTVTIDSLTLSSVGTITITNPTSGASIEVSSVYDASDVLVIDCFNRTVTINGISNDFSGNFPTWESSDEYFTYQDDFTERQVDVNVIYTKRYL